MKKIQKYNRKKSTRRHRRGHRRSITLKRGSGPALNPNAQAFIPSTPLLQNSSSNQATKKYHPVYSSNTWQYGNRNRNRTRNKNAVNVINGSKNTTPEELANATTANVNFDKLLKNINGYRTVAS